MIMLTEQEKQRYLRHILLEEIGEKGQEKLKAAKVLVIGAGGLGCPVLQYLAGAGVGKIGILDDDRVDPSNLQRQVLYSEKNIGEFKVTAARNRLQEMNSSIEIVPHNARLSPGNAERLFSKYDIMIEGSDNFTTKYLASDAAVLTGKPLVFGSIHKFRGQVSVFNYDNGPTYRCLFPEPGSPVEMPSCSEVGVLGILPGIIGNLQANEVLKMILGIGDILSGKLLLFDSLSMTQQLLPFWKNQDIKIETLEETLLSCETGAPSINHREYQKHPHAYTLLDVRTTSERETFHIGGLHVPISELSQRSKELASKDHILVYCATGKRSMAAISILQELFPGKIIRSLEGGITALQE